MSHDADSLNGNPNLDDAVRVARRLGVDVSVARRTGELVFVHPVGRCRVNCRRKDSPRALLHLLRRVQKSTAVAAA